MIWLSSWVRLFDAVSSGVHSAPAVSHADGIFGERAHLGHSTQTKQLALHKQVYEERADKTDGFAFGDRRRGPSTRLPHHHAQINGEAKYRGWTFV